MAACRLHCSANGLLGNGLDVAISSMVYGQVTHCAVTYSFAFGSSKRRKSSWDETWVMTRLRIAPSPFARQVEQPPDDLPYVCSSRSVRGRLEQGGYVEQCNHTRPSRAGLTVVYGRDIAITSYTAFMPPGISHPRFMEMYAATARELRIRTASSGPHHNLSYAAPCLGARMVGVHLRTGRTTHDLKCSTQRGKARVCQPANESRFDIPLERVGAAARMVALRHGAPAGRMYVAFDDRTHPSDPRYRGFSTLDALRDLFPSAWYTPSAIRALWSFDDHRLLSTSLAIVAFEFSSFSWTAAQMGGIPYYVLRCTDKCRRYECSSCSSLSVGVRTLSDPRLEEQLQGEHRTGRPLDEHLGERKGQPVFSIEPTMMMVPWRNDGCRGDLERL
ncbi:hypothetical protein AB1Y20_007035 [Prymnesium parvum]|uniref:Uncharacterized protein n=1 Tax=Prymnesium parvum TaxID=97485 RepID=A0AB34IZ95_PRYPA